MTDFSKDYRYHPESQDTLALCKQLETKLPTARFAHKYRRESITGKLLLWIEGWDDSNERYYGHVLRDHQEPTEVAERFYNRLQPKPKIWLPY